MQWQGDAILLNVHPHGENGAIVTAISKQHGRYKGYIKGAGNKRMRPTIQVGNRVHATWSARLSEQLGTFAVEPLQNHAAPAFMDAGRLHALSSACALMDKTLPEREPAPHFYDDFQALLVILEYDNWLPNYCKWEISLLSHLGFLLDFTKCNDTGQTHDLAYISPKTGCAISQNSGKPWHDRLLQLPKFLIEDDDDGDMHQYHQSLVLSRHFLEKLSTGYEYLEIPEPRSRLQQWVAKQI